MNTPPFRRFKSLGFFLNIASLTILASMPSWGASVQLTILNDTAAPNQAAPEGVYDAGTLDPLGSMHIEHTFQVRNDGKSPVIIDDLTSSCGCTTALMVAAGQKQTLPASLAPGQSAGIDVQVDLEAGLTGTVEKFVWVHAENQSDAAAILEIKALMPPLAVLTPTMLDFGSQRAGDEKQLTLYALVSPELKARNLQLSLAGALPYLKISTPVAAGTAPAPNGIKGAWPRLQFTVTLEKSAPICSFAADLQAEVHGPALSGDPGGLLATVYAVAQGKVLGDISSSPSILSFGTVKEGQGAARSLTITGVSPSVLTGLTVASSSPWVVVMPAASVPGNSRGYTVAIRPSAPAGALNTKITFATTGGQSLEVKVLAYVASSAAQ